MLMKIALLIASYIITCIFVRLIANMIINSGKLSTNYKGDKIPGIMGISIIVGCIVTGGIAVALNFIELFLTLYILFSSSFIGFIGLLDDLTGNNQSKGFKGHILCLVKGKLTTGGLKALMGGVVSFSLAVYISRSLTEIVINTLIIGLVTNVINLFDVRPGRALKVFFILSILILTLGRASNYFYIIIGAVLAYFPLDLKAKGMLGDTGSNFLGVILGTELAVSTGNNLYIGILFVIFMLSINIISEKYSFSQIIDKNRVLRLIDMMGR